MDIPPIHCCNMLTLENEKLAMKYHKLTKKYKVVEKRLQELTDQLKQEQIEKERQNFIERIVSPPAHSEEKVKYKLKDPKARSIPISKKKSGSSNIYQRKLNLSEDKTSRILSMHNELIKKYEKEMKLNTSRTEKITKLALEKSDLQRQLNDQREFIRELQKQLDAKERMQKCQQVKSRLTPKTTDLKNKLLSLEAERDSLKNENLQLKRELGGLDKGFFEEIEDLKYALQKSARLNTEYEQVLRKMCKEFGVEYASAVKKSTKKLKRKSRDREFTIK